MDTLQENLLKSFQNNYNNIAIVTSSRVEFSYKELLICAFSKIYEIEKKIGCGRKVLIKYKKMENTIIAMLACLFTNNTFIILDYKCSPKRQEEIADNIGSNDILTDSMELRVENNIDINSFAFIITTLKNRTYDDSIPTYIYFTSGTTGKPKAVLGKNYSLLHFLLWELKEFSVNYLDRFGQITNPIFDPFLRDIFVPLLSGARIVLRPKDEIIFSPKLFFKWIIEENITILHCTPSIINALCVNKSEVCVPLLRLLLFAGQKVLKSNFDLWKQFFSQETQFVNLYGPTETTLAKCFHVLNRKREYNDILPVGKPIDDCNVYIINEKHQVCETNIIGEVCIDMRYGSWGYANEIKSDKFVSNLLHQNQILYLTGDKGYWNMLGELVILGRTDRQVKINGIRIELDGIENIISEINYVKDTAVALSGKKIIAFVVLDLQVPEAILHIKEVLEIKFPFKALPCSIVIVDYIYLTKSGKKDYPSMINLYLKNL